MAFGFNMDLQSVSFTNTMLLLQTENNKIYKTLLVSAFSLFGSCLMQEKKYFNETHSCICSSNKALLVWISKPIFK